MAVPSTVSAMAPASLYVGDLHPDVTDGQLFNAFSEFKSLASVRVCRDSSTGRSLCYGYVNFISPQDAIRAIEMKNHTALNGKLMRIMWSLRDPDARKSGIGNVYVKNLSESIDNVGLQYLFGKFGTIISCKVAMFEDGKSKGHGFVQFDSEDSANSAIEKLNGSIVGDKQIYVGKFVKKSDRVLPIPDVKYTNLYVKNLDLDISEDILLEKFTEFGKIVCLVIAKDENGASRGFGFVNFENPDDARLAMERMNGTELGSKVLYVGRAQKKAEREQILRLQLKRSGSNVYVKNIDDDVTDEGLKELQPMLYVSPQAIICGYSSEEGGQTGTIAAAVCSSDAGLAGSSTAVIPGGYPSLYYAAPPGVVSQVSPRAGLMYQPLALVGLLVAPRYFLQVSNTQRQHKQSRGRMNGHVFQEGGTHSVSFIQQPTQSLTSSKDPSNQRAGQANYVPNARTREAGKGSGVSYAVPTSLGPASQGSEMLSSMLAAASPRSKNRF
ncbi:hypothetical protein GH714_038785 [Hevea brasiliensis]|uniref:RRM domain-containing protein n=1 Tax=Hevea brasiliensis TaxID=3981 RepID=A0A6A6KP23_HEVBR|nr:hypothetical protein GH714_038785 [Hevea brasiliensis]